MGDVNQVRDRTLVLRVLVPGLEARLSDKMKEAEDAAARRVPPSTNTGKEPKDILTDLEGVTCEPTKDGSTLWNFHCDGATYPARLVNLPCPGTQKLCHSCGVHSATILISSCLPFLSVFTVELHKTHDHAMYYKCVDIAQMLIVYEDEMALEEAEAGPKSEGFPSYYHSGLTPPMKRVVERRFEAREHKAVAPPKHEVGEVEIELQGLMDRISKDALGRTKKAKTPAPVTNKVVEEIVEDIVDYEPWMDDHGRQPYGIEFHDKDALCTKHPELWLNPDEIAEFKRIEAEKEMADADAVAAIAAATKKKTNGKKDGIKKKKKAMEKEEGPSVKKGIPAKKNIEEVDQVTQAATQMSHFLDPDEFLFGPEFNDDFFVFEDGDPLADLSEHNIS